MFEADEVTAGQAGLHGECQLAREVSRAMTTNGPRALVAGAVVAVGLAVTVALAVAAGDPPTPADPPAPAGAKPRDNRFHVAGRVTDPDGRPVEGAEVWASSGLGTLRPTGPVKTDKDGRYELAFGPGVLMQGGRVGGLVGVLHVRKPGFFEVGLCRHADFLLADEPPAAKEQGRPPTGGGYLVPGVRKVVDFRLARAAALRVRLVDGAGKPLAKARVAVTGRPEDLYPASSVLASGETDADGRFAVADVPLRRYRVVLEKPFDQVRREANPFSAEVTLGEVQFDRPAEYALEATVHEWSADVAHFVTKVTRGNDRR